MNRWLALFLLAVGIALVLGVIVAIVAWGARRYERRVGTGADDGGHLEGASELDHLAIDQAHDDAHH